MDGRGVVLIVSTNPWKAPWSEYSGPLYSGIVQGAADIGAPILIAHEHGLQTSMPVGFLDYPLRGVVLVGHFTSEILRCYERLPVPVVLADTPTDRKVHSVTVDNITAAKDAVKRLVELGHRRIGFVRFVLYSLREVDPDSKERQTGFLQGCQECGLPVTNDWIFNALPSGKPDLQTMRRLVGKGSHFTAAIASDTGGANLVKRAAEQFGREIPRQLSLVSFASKPDRTYSGPRIDFTELGRQAAPLLDQPKEPPIRLRVKSEWFDGGSIVKAD